MSFGRLSAEDYKIYLLGIPIVNVSMEFSSNASSFHAETFGLIHSIWPVNNYYHTQYDSISFGVRQYEKLINQGRYSSELQCYYDFSSSSLIFNDINIVTVDSIQNIFTLLSRLSIQSIKEIDAKWFPMNHEGESHRARFLWVGAETVDINDSDVLCDHYRLDIEKIDGNSVKFSSWDYFTDHISSSEAIRQLWIEKYGKRRIVRATVSLYGMTILAELQKH